MNGFLVLAGCGMDNVPMGMFSDVHAATAMARATTEADVKRVAGDLLNIDVSNIICVDVITFTDGYPAKREIVKTFDD